MLENFSEIYPDQKSVGVVPGSSPCTVVIPEPEAPREPVPVERATAPVGSRDRREGKKRADQEQQRLWPLVVAIRGGDQQALATFYEITLARTFAVVRSILGDHHDTEEVLGDTYFQIWTSAQLYSSDKGSIIGWVTVIARSRALDYRRRMRRYDPQVVDKHLRKMKAGMDSGQTLEEIHEVFEQGSYVRAVLKELSSSQQWLLYLAFYQDLPHSEIARVTGRPLGTIKSQIRRTLLQLKKRIKC